MLIFLYLADSNAKYRRQRELMLGFDLVCAWHLHDAGIVSSIRSHRFKFPSRRLHCVWVDALKSCQEARTRVQMSVIRYWVQQGVLPRIDTILIRIASWKWAWASQTQLKYTCPLSKQISLEPPCRLSQCLIKCVSDNFILQCWAGCEPMNGTCVFPKVWGYCQNQSIWILCKT